MHIKTFLASLAVLAFILPHAPAQQPQASPALTTTVQSEVLSADTIYVNVLGQVNQQAQVALPKGSGLLDAISRAGGTTKFADTSKIMLIHKSASEKPDTEKINFNAIILGTTKDIVLRNGDTVIVNQRAVVF
jgi:protein involved in polysaccharide export with SLBB domain